MQFLQDYFKNLVNSKLDILQYRYINFDVFRFWNHLNTLRDRKLNLKKFLKREVDKYLLDIYLNKAVLNKYRSLSVDILIQYSKKKMIPSKRLNDWSLFVTDSIIMYSDMTELGLRLYFGNTDNHIQIQKELSYCIININMNSSILNANNFKNCTPNILSNENYKEFNPCLLAGGIYKFLKFSELYYQDWHTKLNEEDWVIISKEITWFKMMVFYYESKIVPLQSIINLYSYSKFHF